MNRKIPPVTYLVDYDIEHGDVHLRLKQNRVKGVLDLRAHGIQRQGSDGERELLAQF